MRATLSRTAAALGAALALAACREASREADEAGLFRPSVPYAEQDAETRLRVSAVQTVQQCHCQRPLPPA